MTRAINTLCQILGMVALVGLYEVGGWVAFALGVFIIVVVSYDAFTSGVRGAKKEAKSRVSETPDEDPR